MRTPFVALVLVIVFAIPALAGAQTPSDDIYDPADKTAAKVAVSASSGGGDDDGDNLPFTGLEVGLVVLAGAAVLGTGLAIRRATRAD